MLGIAVDDAMWVQRAKTLAFYGLVVLILTSIGVLLVGTEPAHAKTFTVNSTGDALDVSPPNGNCDVDPRVLVTQCTLREALEEANSTSQNPGADTINFNIPSSSCNAKTGVCTIAPASALPDITEALTIDGYTQRPCSSNPAPCSRPNRSLVGTNAKLLIQLNGTNTAGSGAIGLRIEASDSEVKGLVINRFLAGIGIDGDNNTIEGNFIGTNAAGTAGLGNRTQGVSICCVGPTDSPNDNVVGGDEVAERNLISANGETPNSGEDGVAISGSGNQVLGNLIGTDHTGTEDLGNGDSGVTFYTAGNTVGGDAAASANVIAFNGNSGVIVYNIGSYGNAILRNSIFSNTELGIDLHGDGRTPNDAGDGDDGPNHFQNFPVISSAVTAGNTTTIEARLNSTPLTTLVVRFYSNPSDDNEGKRYLGKMTVSTLASGNTGTFTFPANAVGVGQRITATATTDPGGDTSEFSAPREVTGA